MRVKFNPLALLLDSSLEGEFDLVQRIIYEVKNCPQYWLTSVDVSPYMLCSIPIFKMQYHVTYFLLQLQATLLPYMFRSDNRISVFLKQKFYYRNLFLNPGGRPQSAQRWRYHCSAQCCLRRTYGNCQVSGSVWCQCQCCRQWRLVSLPLTWGILHLHWATDCCYKSPNKPYRIESCHMSWLTTECSVVHFALTVIKVTALFLFMFFISLSHVLFTFLPLPLRSS